MLSSLRSLSGSPCRVKFTLFLGLLCLLYLSIFIKNDSKEKYLSYYIFVPSVLGKVPDVGHGQETFIK